jgi:hypothetical protein
MANAVNVGCFSYHQAAMVDTRLHPADVVSHNEHDVGLLLGGQWQATGGKNRKEQSQAPPAGDPESASRFHKFSF